MSTLTLYTHPESRGVVARWMLEETGQPYRTEYLEYGTTMKSPEYLAINPMGKVPAIRHDTTVVTENAAICAYLADAFPAAGLAPPSGSRERGDYYRWLFFVAGPLEAAVLTKMGGATLDPRSAGYGSLEDVLATLESLVSSREFVAGERFSAADLMLSAYLGWYMQFGVIDKRPAFEAYAARHAGREAGVRARASEAERAAAKA
ncbi:glutathione S-transferase family protein [Marilutibacter aestuarii]|uniref:Glutathione S-transferase family protein n=1 Tax=Marilutibacter aestuarii TaxID=1706195 RepID=A0A507ZYY8_9GAMM|nr:glutathione S-transferase family protein [Lysobacter aestuarii]TQD40928.1 glutathione S-transferase family protein [Lysobacter aestuarii]